MKKKYRQLRRRPQSKTVIFKITVKITPTSGSMPSLTLQTFNDFITSLLHYTATAAQYCVVDILWAV